MSHIKRSPGASMTISHDFGDRHKASSFGSSNDSLRSGKKSHYQMVRHHQNSCRTVRLGVTIKQAAMDSLFIRETITILKIFNVFLRIKAVVNEIVQEITNGHRMYGRTWKRLKSQRKLRLT